MIVEIKNPSAKVWNEALEKAGPNGTIFQSTYWAEYLRKTYGDLPIYLAYFDNMGNIRGLLLAFESCYAKHPAVTQLGKSGMVFGKFYKHVAAKLLHKVLPFIYWEGGPVVLRTPQNRGMFFDEEVIYREIVNRITDIAISRNCYEIKFARPSFFDDKSAIYSSLGFHKRRMGTILVNLDQTVDNIWCRIERETRRRIKRTMDQGVELKEVNKLQELKEFYDICVQKSVRTETKIYPFSYYANLWKSLYPYKKIVAFTLSLKDKPLGVLIFLMHNKIIHIHSGGDSDYARSNKIQATRALIWSAIKWAHERGFKYFDLAGVELFKIHAGDRKALNIYKFKSMFGGQLVEFHDYELAFRSPKTLKILNRFLVDTL